MTVRSVVGYVAVFTLLTLIVFAAGIQPSALTPIAFLLTCGAWLSFLVLGRAAMHRPRIGALTERAFIALVIAALGTVSCVIVLNTDRDHAFFPSEVASLLFRLAIIAVLSVPSLWLVLWLTGQLGQSDDRKATLARIEEALAENTLISQGARDDAHEAAEVANSVNEKIARAEANILGQSEDRATDRADQRRMADTVDSTAGQVSDIHDATVKP